MIAANKHTTAAKINATPTDLINEYAKLDLTGMWGDGRLGDAAEIGGDRRQFHRVLPPTWL
ncbi:hypothetical protein [Sphaerisporangium fuscum]|uniref:hypothetical protein n=1 Tax=Sphaerisporangium fuscum TaxID=2835868 RepID=UPI001BDCE4C9|nr:hypothetical protein [Sphaerisporangium fuscum]